MRFVRKIEKTIRTVVKHCSTDWEEAEKYCLENKDCEIDSENDEIVVVRKFKQTYWT